jgi:hypothetical protein
MLAIAGYMPHLVEVPKSTPGYRRPTMAEVLGCKPEQVPLLDLRGEVYGDLRVLEIKRRGPRGYQWICVCQKIMLDGKPCNARRDVTTYDLEAGLAKSCGRHRGRR